MELLFKDPREYLHFEHQLRRARRPSYSMRAFARDLSVSPSSLNDFLKARVGMSEDRIESIASSLRWSPLRKEHFRDLVLAKFDRDAGTRQSATMRIRCRLKDGSYGLSLEAFKIISEWYHLAILELCTLKNHLDSAQIATELKLSPAIANKAVSRLLKLKLLKKNGIGLKPEEDTSHFGDEGTSEAIKTFHSQIMDLAQKALYNNEGEESDSLSLIYSVPNSELGAMNAEIRKSVLDIINRYAQNDKPNCIQALSLQIFPVWNSHPGENK